MTYKLKTIRKRIEVLRLAWKTMKLSPTEREAIRQYVAEIKQKNDKR
jgi:hypothetical protein